MTAEFTKANVRTWMRSNGFNHEDRHTGEIDMTGLAEAAADAFNQNHVSGPLDDETHWIWEEAAREAERFQGR